MVAGLPGTGIGGMFYLLSALLMPLKELINTFCGRSNKSRWKLVGSQTGLALGIIAGFWLTGLLLGFMLRGVVQNNPFHMSKIFMVHPMFLSIATLFGVLVGVQILDIIIGRKLIFFRRRSTH